MSKIFKPKGEALSPLETVVNQQLAALERNEEVVETFRNELKGIHFLSAKEIEVKSEGGNREAVVIFVPFKFFNKLKSIQPRLMKELEKKISGKHFIFLAQRTIFSKQYKRISHGQLRPRSRTLTSVHASILNDLVFPSQIVGQRTRVRQDGSRLMKVYLDSKDEKEANPRLASFGAVYKKLTNKNVEFLFPSA